MPIQPVQLPPGMLKNGTPYQQRGRWIDGNLVRWRDRVAQNIGGWSSRFITPALLIIDGEYYDSETEDIVDGGGPETSLDVYTGGGASDIYIVPLVDDSSTEVIRDMFAWRSNSQDQHLVVGSNMHLLHVSQTDAVTDVTPVGANTSDKDPQTEAGYGRNPYGVGAYGVANDLIATDPLPPQRWAFSTFGELLLFLQVGSGDLYEMSPSTLTPVAITTAPENAVDVLVTDQRIVMVIGGDAGPRSVQWSDQENRAVWTPAITNQAGEQTLPGVGKLLRCVSVLGQVLIIGESDVNVATYLGAPFVYGFRLAGTNCGAICPQSVLVTERFVAWWGQTSFWVFDGSLQAITCDVMEFLEQDVDASMVSKISCFSIHQFNEIWWLYQSASSTTTEVDSYVIWNYKTRTWSCGRLNRTSGIDAGVLRYPLMISNLAELWTHEQENVTPIGDVYVETGPLDIANGEVNLAVRYLYPDTTEFGQVEITAYAKQFPTDGDLTYGPYAYGNPTSMRVMGRQIRLRYDLVGQQLRVGDMRIEYAPIGTGRR